MKRNNFLKELFLRKVGILEFLLILWILNNREKKDYVIVEIVIFKGLNFFVCDLIKIFEVGKKVDMNVIIWRSKEMLLLWRYFLVSEVVDVCVEDYLFFFGVLCRINFSSSFFCL